MIAVEVQMQIFQHLHHHPVRSRIDRIQLASLRLNRLQAKEHNGYAQRHHRILTQLRPRIITGQHDADQQAADKAAEMRGQRNTRHQTDHQVDTPETPPTDRTVRR